MNKNAMHTDDTTSVYFWIKKLCTSDNRMNKPVSLFKHVALNNKMIEARNGIGEDST